MSSEADKLPLEDRFKLANQFMDEFANLFRNSREFSWALANTYLTPIIGEFQNIAKGYPVGFSKNGVLYEVAHEVLDVPSRSLRSLKVVKYSRLGVINGRETAIIMAQSYRPSQEILSASLHYDVIHIGANDVSFNDDPESVRHIGQMISEF